MISNSIETCDSDSKDKLAKTLLAINRAYQDVVQEKIDKLKKLLQLNLQQQNDIIEKISSRKINTPFNFANIKSESKKCDNELSKIKENYFKDRFQSEPEDNEDTLKRNKFVYYDYTPQLKSEWSLEYRVKLKEAVLNDSIRIIKTPFVNKIKYLEEKLYNLRMSDDDTRQSELYSVQKLLRECKSQLNKVDSTPVDNILEQVSSDKIDWMKISNVDLSGNWSSTECFLVWTNVCHPRINQNKWTTEENLKLIELARRFREKNWEQIATLLNTNRSAFLCMKRYHEKTADKYCKRDWTEEELQELLVLAEKHRIGHFVPYNYLCYLNGTRDRNTVYLYHLKIDPSLNHGRWTQNEDQAFDEAIQYYSTQNWQEISEYIGSRTPFQCREKYELKYLNPDKYKYWTLEEDKKLLDLVDEYGGQWSKIAANEFPFRTDHSCLFRYTKLMNWRKQNEWFESQPDEIKEFILFLFKKRKKQEENSQVQLYTNKGDLVPTLPKFGPGTSFLTTIIDKIYEKKELVIEFINKKREGQISLTLLAKIGIYTPILNNLISKYKKYHLKLASNQNEKNHTDEKPPRKKKKKMEQIEQPTTSNNIKDELVTPKKKKTKRTSKKENLVLENFESTVTNTQDDVNKENKEMVMNAERILVTKESNRIKKKYTKKPKQTIRLMSQLSQEQTEQTNLTKENSNINLHIRTNTIIKKDKKIKKKNKKFLSQMASSTSQGEILVKKSPKKKTKNKKLERPLYIGKLKISQILDFIQLKNSKFSSFEEAISSKQSLLIETNDISSKCLLTVDRDDEVNEEKTIDQENQIDSNVEKAVNQSKRKLSTNNENQDSPKAKRRKYKPREKKKNENLTDGEISTTQEKLDTPKPKKNQTSTKKTKSDKKVKEPKKPAKSRQPCVKVNESQIINIKSNQSMCNKKPVEQNPLVVNFDTIEDGSKIPCLSEYPNEFKYLYSLKKEKNTNFFYKFTVINCRGSLVAIKPLNGSFSSNYLNELRLNAIEKALKKVSILK